jgi:hypothetical protein
MKTKFTPAPWKVRRVENYGNVFYAISTEENNRFRTICETRYNYEYSDSKANAELIAKSPEMYDLLSRLNYAFYVEGTVKALKPIMAEIKPLLQKIRGEI